MRNLARKQTGKHVHIFRVLLGRFVGFLCVCTSLDAVLSLHILTHLIGRVVFFVGGVFLCHHHLNRFYPYCIRSLECTLLPLSLCF